MVSQVNSSLNDALYTQEFENYIRDFYRLTSNETNIPALAQIITFLETSDMLSILMKDPRNEHAKVCVRAFIQSRAYLPQDFLARFLAVVNLKIILTPNGIGFVNQSYNAKVIATNIRPPIKITNLTLKNRQNMLREDALKSQTLITPRHRIPPQTLRLKFNDSLLPKCINSIVDLSQIIKEGNNANGVECDDYIKTNMLK